jgi:tetratricopeptide (TPR) repeat protein
MNEQRFLQACELREAGKLREAVDEFVKLADTTEDRVDKAGILWSAATTSMALQDFDLTRQQLKQVRILVPMLDNASPSDPDRRLFSLLVGVLTEEADLAYVEGKKEEALIKLSHLLDRHGETLRSSQFRDAYRNVQVLRAYLLADHGSWTEALPILEEAQHWETRKDLISFYLGHCYLASGDYLRAEQKLAQAVTLSLPAPLDYKAHCELGTALFMLKDYARAKTEFKKCAETADPIYMKQCKVWKWLEKTCRALGLRDEEERYRRLATPS